MLGQHRRELAERWHGVGRTRYAVTPRFSLSSSDALLESCAALAKDVKGAWFTSHLNENLAEKGGCPLAGAEAAGHPSGRCLVADVDGIVPVATRWLRRCHATRRAPADRPANFSGQ